MCLQYFFYITEVPMQQNQVLSQSAREKRAIEKELMRDPPVGHVAANVLKTWRRVFFSKFINLKICLKCI